MASNGFILNVFDLDLTPVGELHVELPIRIGRSSLNDVTVAHRLVSEFHARIESIDGRLCVRDLSSKNGVLVESVGHDGPQRITAQTPIDLEPYGNEFLLSPLLRVRVRPATVREAARGRRSQAFGSVLGNTLGNMLGLPPGDVGSRQPEGVGNGRSGTAFEIDGPHAPERLGDGYGHAAASRPTPLVPAPPPALPTPVVPSSPLLAAAPRLLSPRPGSRPPRDLAPPPTLSPLLGAKPANDSSTSPGFPAALPPRQLHGDFARGPSLAPASASPALSPYASVFVEPSSLPLELPPLPRSGEPLAPLTHERAQGVQTRLSPTPPPRATLLEPSEEPLVPALAHTAWERGNGTMPVMTAHQTPNGAEWPVRSLEALALRGLRELAASLVPGQPVETASDVVQLVTKLHDALEMFCRCFIPVREAGSRFVAPEALERAAAERCHQRSDAYLAVERALEPSAVAAALLDWRNPAEDAPQAVEHILADLMLHQLTLSQAALEGTRALLGELAPHTLEAEHHAREPRTPSMLSRLGLSGARERMLWEIFAERHRELEAAGAAFRELFGEAFTRAYAAHAPGASTLPPV